MTAYYVNGAEAGNTLCGTCDLYIDGLFSTAITRSLPTLQQPGYSYEIRNIQALEGFRYVGSSGGLSKTNQYQDNTVKLYFASVIGQEWQELPALPDDFDPTMYDVEYKNHYEYTGRTSPGSGWTLYKQGELQYENDGAAYNSDNQLTTSATRVQVGHYYFHWCGSSADPTWGSYTKRPGSLEVYHTIPMSDLNGFQQIYSAPDDGRTVYKFKNVSDGTQANCPLGCPWYYEGYVYHNKKAYRINTYVRDSDWTSEIDTSAASVTYRVRLKQFLISFDANGGEVNLEDAVKYYGIDIELPTIVPERRGFTFVAWTLNQDGNGAEYLPGEVFSLNENAVLFAQWRPTDIMRLPNDLKTIEEEAFANCNAYIIYVPNGCTTILDGAFMNNAQLLEIHIPASVTSIAFDAFENCPNIVIYAPEGSRAAKLATSLGIPYIAE